jgi:hypothetical protein
MPVREITFEEPGLAEGTPIPSITKDGVTVRFLTRVAIFRPGVTTESPPKALMNYGQDIFDDAGSSRPIIFEFSHLQHWVHVHAGLNERDPSTPNGVTARLIAYNSSGREVSSDSRRLGNGPTPIRTLLEVRTSGHVIRRVKLEYDSNVREVIDNLKFQAGQSVLIPHDTDAPVVEILQPTEGQQVNSRNILVSGRIREVNGVTLVINGRSVPVQLVGPGVYSFNAEVTLPEGTNTIEAIATDEDHNTGSDRRIVDIRIPASFLVSDLVFTQNGFLDPATPRPTRRVAGKTSLFRLRLEIRTADGRPTSVDAANIVVER